MAHEKIILPLPPEDHTNKLEMEIYARFMRHLRHAPGTRTEIKILSAIQFTADMMDCSDAHIAKSLVDMGLRAPRFAFPADFLGFVDSSLKRTNREIGAPNLQLRQLRDHWDILLEENRIQAFRKVLPQPAPFMPQTVKA